MIILEEVYPGNQTKNKVDNQSFFEAIIEALKEIPVGVWIIIALLVISLIILCAIKIIFKKDK